MTNTEITADKYKCGLRRNKRLGPFNGCVDGVGRWCDKCPCLRRKLLDTTDYSVEVGRR